MERLRGTRWGLVHCRAGELLCADNHGGHLYMPISPTAAFLGGYQDGTLTLDDVQACNRLSVATADRSEEHTSELQSLMRISYAVFCLKKKTIIPCTITSQ